MPGHFLRVGEEDGLNFMAQFKTKSAVIEVFDVRNVLASVRSGDWGSIPEFIRNAYDRSQVEFGCDHIVIARMNANFYAFIDDLLLKGVKQENGFKGEVHAISKEAFEAIYEAVL